MPTGEDAENPRRSSPAAASEEPPSGEGRESVASRDHAEPWSLLNPDTAAGTTDSGLGTPGPPVSRHSPFYIGFWGTLGVLAALALGLWLREASSIIVLVVVAVFLAVGLNPFVEWLMRRGLPRWLSVLVVTLGMLGAVALFVAALVPVLRDQITALIDNAPGWLDALRDNQTIQNLDDKYGVIDTINDKLKDPKLAQDVFGSVFSVGLAVFSALANAFIVFVLTLYFLAALPQIKRACYSLAPASRRARVTYLGDEILRRVGGYVVGAFLIALCAGVSSFVFMEIAGLGEYALALALLVGILDFIPLVGATIGAVVVTIIGFATSVTIGVACLIFFIIYQQVENYVIYPRVMSSSVDIPGVVIVIAVLIGGSLLGVVGALLAIPIAAAILLLLREIVVRRQELS
ncbi:MAG: AI-2E family transporter [Nocardioidaceae bacterium]